MLPYLVPRKLAKVFFPRPKGAMLIAYKNAFAPPLEINATVNTAEKRIRENITRKVRT